MGSLGRNLYRRERQGRLRGDHRWRGARSCLASECPVRLWTRGRREMRLSQIPCIGRGAAFVASDIYEEEEEPVSCCRGCCAAEIGSGSERKRGENANPFSVMSPSCYHERERVSQCDKSYFMAAAASARTHRASATQGPSRWFGRGIKRTAWRERLQTYLQLLLKLLELVLQIGA